MFDSPVEVMGDPTRLQQVIWNLLSNVFDYFRQEDGSTTRSFGGLRLGLGQGATFTLCLPLTEPSVESLVEGLQPTASSNLQGTNVLVVDDDADSRDLMTFVLEQSGASVTTVTTAEEVLQTLLQDHHHVLVSDVGMPEMDGYELMRQVRTLPPQNGGEIPAIRRDCLCRGHQSSASRLPI